MEKIFKSFNELATDPIFIKEVERYIREVVMRRVNRPEPIRGMRYKRDWYDKMNGTINSPHFISEIEAIWLKKSTLPSQERNVIQSVCEAAFKETLRIYAEMPDINSLQEPEDGTILKLMDKLQV